jgi:DNA-binding MarR family transcriptional regulator
LASHTITTSGGMSKDLDCLQSRGLVDRRSATLMGAARVVSLPPAGRRLIDRAISEHMANEHRLLSDLRAEDVELLQRSL